MSLMKIASIKQINSKLKGFICPVDGEKVDHNHSQLPNKRTNEGFNPYAYKQLAKA